MECDSCGQEVKDGDLFCCGCGTKFVDILKDSLKKELQESLNEDTPPPVSAENQSSQDSSENKPQGYDESEVSYDTADPRKLEYKTLFKRVLADRKITPDEIIQLENEVKRLGLEKWEEELLRKDVANELGINYEQIGELCVSSVNLLINANKCYTVGQRDFLNLLIENISSDPILDISLHADFSALDNRISKPLNRLNPSEKREVNLSFRHTEHGTELVEVYLEFFDIKGNPYVYKGEFDVKIFEESQINNGNTVGSQVVDSSINISFDGAKVMGNDFSNFLKILENRKSESACVSNVADNNINVGFDNAKVMSNDFSNFIQTDDNKGSEVSDSESREKSSFCDRTKHWNMLFIFYDEPETIKRRNEILIEKKIKEGETKFNTADRLKAEAEALFLKDREQARVVLENAYKVFKESKECFKKVREIDPENGLSYDRIQGIRTTIELLESRIKQSNIKIEEPAEPKAEITSGTVTSQQDSKKYFLYSKNRITLGRSSSNDIPLLLLPIRPPDKYMENRKKSSQISGSHAEIINKPGGFYIRDVGSNNQGSKNGTYLEGRKIEPLKEIPLTHGGRISIARVLDLECEFLGDLNKVDKGAGITTSCETVLGDLSDSCFGIDKKGIINAIRIRRRNNASSEEEYIILIRELTIGSSRGNGIILSGDTVQDRHAKLFYKENQYWIEDLNSRHGTKVNGKELEPGVEVPLGRKSGVIIGNVPLVFEGF